MVVYTQESGTVSELIEFLKKCDGSAKVKIRVSNNKLYDVYRECIYSEQNKDFTIQ